MRSMIMGALVALAVLVAAPAAFANHPLDDIKDRVKDNKPQPALDGWEDPNCDEQTVGEDPGDPFSGGNPNGQWGSLDGEMWECMPDPGLPGVPGLPGKFWEPRPNIPAGADVAWARRWDVVTTPGGWQAWMYSMARTEWVNPFTKAPGTTVPAEGACPNVSGGCKYKAGGDIFLYRNGQPFQVHQTWLNRALQTYVYNPTTNVWEKKHDTGWQMNNSATYVSSMTSTWNYGTAPYGARYYFTREQVRVWNGSAWSSPVVQDPRNADGTLDYVWDDPPGDKTKKPKKPKAKPAVEKVKKTPSSVQPDVSEPSSDAVEVPQ